MDEAVPEEAARQTLSFDLSQSLGIRFSPKLLVKDVQPGSQAAASGIDVKGWRLLSLAGESVQTSKGFVAQLDVLKLQGVGHAELVFAPWGTSAPVASASATATDSVEITPSSSAAASAAQDSAALLPSPTTLDACDVAATSSTPVALVEEEVRTSPLPAGANPLSRPEPSVDQSAAMEVDEVVSQQGHAEGSFTGASDMQVDSEAVNASVECRSFALAQPIGINFDKTLLVKDVQQASQASEAGVCSGWRVLSVGGELMHTTKELSARWKGLKSQGVQCVEFTFSRCSEADQDMDASAAQSMLEELLGPADVQLEGAATSSSSGLGERGSVAQGRAIEAGDAPQHSAESGTIGKPVLSYSASGKLNLVFQRQKDAAELLEEQKQEVRSKLTEAVQGSSVDALEEAIRSARELDFADNELDQAKHALARAMARRALQEASDSRDIASLHEAIQEAECLGMDGIAFQELDAARGVLQEERKIAAKAQLAAAVIASELGALQEAIQKGQAVGLALEDLAEAESMRARAMARLCLQEAVASRNIASLEKAILEADSLGMDGIAFQDLDTARGVLDEERKDGARAQLAEAIATCDIGFLQQAIDHGKDVALEDADLAEAEDLLVAELRRVDARQQLATAVSARDVPMLELALCEGHAACLSEVELTLAASVLSQEVRSAAAKEGLFLAWESQDIATLEAAITEAEQAGLSETIVVGARLALTEARKVAARERLRQAVGSYDIDSLEAAIEHGKSMGLRTHELQDARKALAAAIRVKWTGILTKEPCDFGVPSLLAKLGDILQMGFQLHFIEEFTLRRISDGGGQTSDILARRLQQLRMIFDSDHVVSSESAEADFVMIDSATKQAVAATFLQGIEVMAPQGKKIAGWSNVLIWLDLTPPEIDELPCGLENMNVPVLPPGSQLPLDCAVSSSLLNLEFRSTSEASSDWNLCAFARSGALLWSSSWENGVQRNAKRKVLSAVYHDTPELWSFRLNLSRMSTEVFALAFFSQSSSSSGSASMCLREIPEAESATFDAMRSGKRPSRDVSGSPRLAADLSQGLDTDGPLVVICRHTDSAGKWLFCNIAGTALARCESANDDDSLVIRRLAQQVSHREGVLTSEDPDFSAWLRCRELHSAFELGGCNVRCVATGMHWNADTSGAMDVVLGGGLLDDLHQAAGIKTQFNSRPLPPAEGFIALCDHVAAHPPGPSGILIRVGRVPEMPVAAVRGSWGFNKTRLCALDFSGILDLCGPNVHRKLDLHCLPKNPALWRSFLVGSLFAKPAPAITRLGTAAAEIPWRRESRPPRTDDPRHVTWLPGDNAGAVELLGDMLGSGPGCAGKAAVEENIPTDRADPPPPKRARVV